MKLLDRVGKQMAVVGIRPILIFQAFLQPVYVHTHYRISNFPKCILAHVQQKKSLQKKHLYAWAMPVFLPHPAQVTFIGLQRCRISLFCFLIQRRFHSMSFLLYGLIDYPFG